jgi:hypothetical protein
VRRDHGEGIIQGRLVFPADQVWHFISGFGSLPDWLPYIPKSELHEGGSAWREPAAERELTTSPGPPLAGGSTGR